MSIMKTVIGVGLLGFPYVMRQFGYVISIILFLIIMSVTHFGSTLLLRAKNLSRHSNYSSLAKNITDHPIYSKILLFLSYFAILLNNLGICI